MYTCPGDHFRALKSEKFGIVLQKALNAVIHRYIVSIVAVVSVAADEWARHAFDHKRSQ